MVASDGQQYIYKADPLSRVAVSRPSHFVRARSFERTYTLLQLYRLSDTSFSEPLAWYNRAAESYSAHLAVVPGVDHIRTEVLAGMMVLRKNIASSYKGWTTAAGVAVMDARPYSNTNYSR
jgi:hypothetical protein